MNEREIQRLLDKANVIPEKRMQAAFDLRVYLAHGRSLFAAAGRQGTPEDHNHPLEAVAKAAAKLSLALNKLRSHGGYPWSRFWTHENFGPIEAGPSEHEEVLRAVALIEVTARAAQVKKSTGTLGKYRVVERALAFFKKYSSYQASTHDKNPFRAFAQLFYETAVGPIPKDEDDFLTRAIRAALNENP